MAFRRPQPDVEIRRIGEVRLPTDRTADGSVTIIKNLRTVRRSNQRRCMMRYAIGEQRSVLSSPVVEQSVSSLFQFSLRHVLRWHSWGACRSGSCCGLGGPEGPPLLHLAVGSWRPDTTV